MIKKISAILLALVLCLSVVVVPVSAMDLGDAVIGYEIKFDKEYYNPGDTAVVSVYVNAAEGYELGTFMISIGFQSSVFTQADNAADDIKASAVSNSAYQMLYADITNANIGWSASNIVTNIQKSCTTEENALYDAYICIQGSRDSASSITNKNGLPTEELNADTEPFVQFSLVVSDAVAEGTAVSAAVTTGSITKNRTYFNYYKNPGNATTIAKMSTLGDSLIVAATASIGEPAPSYNETTPTIVSDYKWQWRDNGDSTYAMRNLATIDGTALNKYLNDATLLAKYGDIEAVAEAVMLDFGFIVAKGGTMDKADAACWHQGLESKNTYETVNPTYLSTSVDSGNYVMSYLITNVPTAEADVQFSSLGYVVLDTNDDGTADEYYYYDLVTTSTFNEVKA